MLPLPRKGVYPYPLVEWRHLDTLVSGQLTKRGNHPFQKTWAYSIEIGDGKKTSGMVNDSSSAEITALPTAIVTAAATKQRCLLWRS